MDIVGKKKLFLIGAALYGVGTFTAAISSSALMLFAGWAVLEGIAGALMLPAIISIISGTYSGERRTFALAIGSVMVAIAAALGPLVGGIMSHGYFGDVGWEKAAEMPEWLVFRRDSRDGTEADELVAVEANASIPVSEQFF